MQYTDVECYYGYSAWQDLAGRLFAGYLIHDTINIATYFPLTNTNNVVMIGHHVLFLVVCLYCLAGSYFRCACPCGHFHPGPVPSCGYPRAFA